VKKETNLTEYLYKIQPVRSELLTEGPTPEEQAIIEKHFLYLQELTEKGTVILAGRTQNTDATSFGIVIFQVESEDDAMKIMMDDPAIVKGVFNSELYPYKISLFGSYHRRK